MRTTFPLILLAMAASMGCSRTAPSEPSAASAKAEACPVCPAVSLPGAATKAGGDVLAVVNGVALTRADVRFALRNRSRTPAAPTPEQEAAILEQLIQHELAAQQAIHLGMQNDLAVVQDLADIEVQRNGQRREKLADVYYRRQVTDQARPVDADVQALWNRDQKQIRTEYHVLQLFARDEARMADARAALKRGESFGDVYNKLVGAPPLGEGRPWDLGFLKYNQTPQQWREILQRLTPGETSDLIRGPNHRFWIIQLVAVRANDALQLADVRSMLEEELAASKREQARNEVETGLSKDAKVERAAPQPQPPRPSSVEP